MPRITNLQFPSDINSEVDNIIHIEIFNRPKFEESHTLLHDIVLLSPAVINSSLSSSYESKQLGGSKIKNRVFNLLDNAANTGINSLSGGTFEGGELTAFKSGKMSSPNLRVLYSGTPLRPHSFTFEFSPESQQDSTALLEIYNLLRKASLAADIDGSQDVEFPYEVQITFLFNGEENKFIPKTKKSVITRISSNFQGSNVLLYRDGSPISRVLSLELLETTAMRRKDIDLGF